MTNELKRKMPETGMGWQSNRGQIVTPHKLPVLEGGAWWDPWRLLSKDEGKEAVPSYGALMLSGQNVSSNMPHVQAAPGTIQAKSHLSGQLASPASDSRPARNQWLGSAGKYMTPFQLISFLSSPVPSPARELPPIPTREVRRQTQSSRGREGKSLRNRKKP